MADDRPANWDWVKAIHECSPEVMFGVLRGLVERDVQRRNEQLEREAFRLTDINGLLFTVSRAGPRAGPGEEIHFGLTDDLAQIVVRARNREPAEYTVGLDDEGLCRFRRDGESLQPWQVLKAALADFLFR